MAENIVFKLLFYHGGILKDGGYEGGTVSMMPCEEDKLSYFEIKGLLKDIGYESDYSIICYSKAGEVLHIEDDTGVKRACMGLDNHSEIKLYIHHSPDVYPFPTQEELDVIYPPKAFELRRSPRMHKSSAPRVIEQKRPVKQKLFEGDRDKHSTSLTEEVVTQDEEYVIGTYREDNDDAFSDMPRRPEPFSDAELGVDEDYWSRVAEEIDTPSKKKKLKKVGECSTPAKERKKKLLDLVEGKKSSDEGSTPRKRSTPKTKEGRRGLANDSRSPSEKGKELDIDSEEEEVPDPLVQVNIDIEGDEDLASEYYDSDELRDIVDEAHKKRTDFRVLDVDRNKEHIELKVGDLFANTAEFRKALQRDAIHVGYEVTYLRNEGTRITCVCSRRDEEKCQWRIHASLTHDRSSFQIKTISGQHTCAKKWKNSFASAEWIASTYEDVIREDLQFDVKALQRRILREHSVEVTLGLLYKARAIMRRKLQGGYKEQYWRIRDYANMVLVKNPGSFIKIQVEQQLPDSPPVFQRIFIAFEAQLYGFKNGCRPFIGLDGCHCTKIDGVLLSATGRDANNEIFPLATAVVESETKDAWKFFLDCLVSALGSVEDHGWIFISDRQKGLVQAFEEVIPKAEHRFCARHMYANMLRATKCGGSKHLFHKCAKSYTIHEFEEEMQNLKKCDPKAWEWISKQHDPRYWCRAFFSTWAKCDLVSNNISESWNGSIMKARDLPILSMLEKLRRHVMTRLYNKRLWGDLQTTYVLPRIALKLANEDKNSRFCKVFAGGGDELEVTQDGKAYLVNLSLRTCDCRKFDLSGIPCCHACAAARVIRQSPELFVHPWLTTEAYKRTYSHSINPIPHISKWIPTGLPAPAAPGYRKKIGRPKKKRVRGIDEGSKNPSTRKTSGSLKCNNCYQFGHNKRTCKNEKVIASKSKVAPSKTPGRPKKIWKDISEFGMSSEFSSPSLLSGSTSLQISQEPLLSAPVQASQSQPSQPAAKVSRSKGKLAPRRATQQLAEQYGTAPTATQQLA